MKELDARGLSCPEPVVMLRKALAAGGNAWQITVDNVTAKENVSRFARHQGCRVEVREEGGCFVLSVTRP